MAFSAGETPLEPKGPLLRALFVAALAAAALAISLPNAYASIYRTDGTFDFQTCDGIVCDVLGIAQKAGIRLGDRLDVRALPADDRFGELLWARSPAPGRTISFPFYRGDTKYEVRLTARRDYDMRSGLDLGVVLAGKVAGVVLVVIVAALFLIRPTPLSGSLALFVLGNFALIPMFYMFLPAVAFVCITILSQALFLAALPVGFLALAFSLGRPWPARLRPFLAALFVLFTLFGTALQFKYLLGLPNILLTIVMYVGIMCALAAGIWTLIGTVLRRATQAGQRVAAVLLAIAGLTYLIQLLLGVLGFLTLTHHVTMPEQALSQLRIDLTQMAALFATAAVAYVIVRERVVDVGLVRSRILSYAAVLLAVLVALGFVNWAFAAQLAGYPFAMPLEIFGAVAIGYWFSGFRDVSSALSLAAVDAPVAAMHGRAVDEHDALSRALGLAERTRQAGLIAEVRARCAFSAWVNGDDPMFEQHGGALREALGSQTLRGVKAFASATTSAEPEYVCDPGDLSEWRARALLLRSAGSEDGQGAARYALGAMRAADQDDDPWLRVLTRVALAESASDERTTRLNEATGIARSCGSLLLVKSLMALRADKPNIGMLQAFVDVRMRKTRPVRPAVEISFFTGGVRVLGEPIELPDKERALLFTVAASNGPVNGDLLADALWPDSDGDAARNALKVCLHRLRRHAGDPRIVRRVDEGYALHPGADVDLWKLEAALKGARKSELEALGHSLRDGASGRATLGLWFAGFEMQLARKLEEVDRLLDAHRTQTAHVSRQEASSQRNSSTG